jgi:DnaJ-class molecular chaperone
LIVARRDYYKILGVDRDADQAAIKRAYRRLVLRYHPDRNRVPRGAARFLKIQEAYTVLSDPEKRRQYELAQPKSATRPSQTGRRAGASRSAATTRRGLLDIVVEGLGISVNVSLGARSISKPAERRRSARRGSRARKARGQ